MDGSMAFDEPGWWTLYGVTDERIPRAALREFLVPIVEKTAGRLLDEEPQGFETPWRNAVARFFGPDAEGWLSVSWHDCGTKPTPIPNECADLVYLCNGHPETAITISILRGRPDGVSLTMPEARKSLEKMECALANIGGMLAERFPSLVFYDESGAFYSSTEMIALSVEGKQRDQSWGYKFARARALRLAQDAELHLDEITHILKAGGGEIR
jgi:hypothetical protein